MWLFATNEKRIRKIAEEIAANAARKVDEELAQLRSLHDASAKLKQLREQIETLTIEKSRKDEEFAKREREIEHKVGLERKRQEFEVEAAKRETTVTVREENLKADRDRFENEMKFQRERFTEEVGYLKGMLEQVLTKLGVEGSDERRVRKSR